MTGTNFRPWHLISATALLVTTSCSPSPEQQASEEANRQSAAKPQLTQEPGARQPGELPSDSKPSSADKDIKVTEFGEGQKSRLRYGPLKIGQSWIYNVVLSTAMQSEKAGQQYKLPALKLELVLQATGETSYRVTIRKGELTSRTQLDFAQNQKLQSAIESAKGASWTEHFDANGQASKVSDYPDTLQENIRELLQSIRAVRPRLPSQELGVGAKWQHSELISGSREIMQQSNCELSEASRDKTEIRCEIEQSGGEAKLNLPGTNKAPQARQLKAQGKGVATIELQLDAPLPTLAESAFSGTIVVLAPGAAPSEAQTVKQSSHLRLELKQD